MASDRAVKAATFLNDPRQPEVSFFSLLIRLDATKFVWLSVCTLIETTCPNFFSKSRLKSAKSPFPVDVRHSKTWLLELRRNVNRQLHWVPSVNTPPFY